jgi:hypothetical protein
VGAFWVVKLEPVVVVAPGQDSGTVVEKFRELSSLADAVPVAHVFACDIEFAANLLCRFD